MKVESPEPSDVAAESLSTTNNSPGPSTLSSPFMQKALPTSPPHPPASPSPTRPAGGEIARIRADEASARAAQQRLTEARRPDYMRRISRGDAPNSNSMDVAGLGIAETPVKGRRIELWGFQETSEESFEERLMAGGYGGYGSTAPDHATTPPALSRALEWANTLTPGPRASSSTASAIQGREATTSTTTLLLPDGASEREARKRRRLEAFRRVPPSHFKTTTSLLHPVAVEGKGRVLLDIGAEEASDLIEELQSSSAPGGSKRRGGKKRRRGGSGTGSRGGSGGRGTRSAPEETTKPARVREGGGSSGAPLDWPDEEFPWNVRTHERRELEAAEEADRMQWIGRFLDEEDSEDADSSESVAAAASAQGEQDGVVSPTDLVDRGAGAGAGSSLSASTRHGGSGKMVPVPISMNLQQRIFVSSDPADARAALLSKQSVRALAARRRLHVQPSTDGDGEEILCICRGKDDGRELVQCDDCRTWYHLECLGITDIAELGREEDPWYCHNCVALMNGLPSSSSEPTFVPVEEVPLHRRRDPLFFEALQDSPAGGADSWRIMPSSSSSFNGPAGPTTPKANLGRAPPPLSGAEASTRSSLGSRNDPHTPRNNSAMSERVRVYDDDERIFQDVSPFDPTSTPSRGMRVGASVGSVFTTPKWQQRRVLPPSFSSPSESPYHHSHRHHHGKGGGGIAATSPMNRMWPHEDTPVDRSAPRPSILASKGVQESPLTGRGVTRGYHPRPQDSPVPLGKKGKERQGAGRR